MAVGLWLLAFGGWLLAFGCWPLAIGLWRLAVSLWLLAFGSWLMGFSILVLHRSSQSAIFALKIEFYMISIDGLAVEFGNTTLFKDISFAINPKDRIALMGKNGAGKSTLLKIIAGVKSPTRGKVSAPKDTVIAYLPTISGRCLKRLRRLFRRCLKWNARWKN